jgi:hypothetical protein
MKELPKRDIAPQTPEMTPGATELTGPRESRIAELRYLETTIPASFERTSARKANYLNNYSKRPNSQTQGNGGPGMKTNQLAVFA